MLKYDSVVGQLTTHELPPPLPFLGKPAKLCDQIGNQGKIFSDLPPPEVLSIREEAQTPIYKRDFQNLFFQTHKRFSFFLTRELE